MTILNKTLRYLFSAAMAIASVLAFAWTLGLIAARQVGTFEAVFLLHGTALAAVIFVLLAAETRVEWPLSILGAAERRTKPDRARRLFLRRAET
ncbi:MAG TPA: hypothetical protein VHD76_00805 [Bryobacteraceae bacterium]|jgi:hypothetical protein|nr:hypothetical protein [Bryobacteraceae bacterium]